MREQSEIDNILKFWCGWCGAKAGEPCRQATRDFGGTRPMRDFHNARTQLAYPQEPSPPQSQGSAERKR